MACTDSRLRWGLLYAVLPITGGLLWLDSRLRLGPRGHTILELGIVLAVFGLAEVWLTANRSALMRTREDRSWREVYMPEEPQEEPILPPSWASGADGNSPVGAPFALYEDEVQRRN